MKKLISVILTVAVIASVASCDGGQQQTTTTTTTPGTTTSATTTAPSTTTTTEKEEETVIPEDSEYVIENGITDRMKALSQHIKGNQARLAKVFKKAQAGEEITVAYLGGSITQGSSATFETCYARLTTDWIEKTFPKAKVNYVNAGIGATGSYIGVFRTDRDVLVHEPDLVFVDFSVNDTTENTQRNIESYEGVLRKLYMAESAPAVVTIAMTMDNKTSFQQYHEEICKHYDIPMISYHNAIHDVIDKGYIKWTDISDDNIHPNIVGHSVLTEMITAYLQTIVDNLDNIDTEAESDFSKIYKSDKFSSAEILTPDNCTPVSMEGWMKRDESFGNFGKYWLTRSGDGTFEGVGSLKFETDAKSIGVFYGEIKGSGAKFDVLVNGTKIKTIDSTFPNGWGSYVEAIEIHTFEDCQMRTIEIVPVTGQKGTLNISAIAITK